jgi:hypothetical protein
MVVTSTFNALKKFLIKVFFPINFLKMTKTESNGGKKKQELNTRGRGGRFYNYMIIKNIRNFCLRSRRGSTNLTLR